MHQLYQHLKPAIDANPSQELLIDEVISLLNNSPQGTLVACLRIMYDNLDDVDINPLKAGLMFIQGLKHNEFFEFVEFIRKLKK